MPSLSDYSSKGQFYTILSPEDGQSKKDNLVIVFLHGLGSSSSFHYPVAVKLANEYTCLLLDHEGAANSKLNRSTLTLEDLSSNLEDVLKETGLDKKEIILAGHSMSGMLINYINIYDSDKFNIVANVLICPVHPVPQASDIFQKRIDSLEGAKSLSQFANSLPSAATGSKCDNLKKAFIRQLILSQTVDGYVANCRAIISGGTYDLANKYSLIKKPTLIICGEEDKTSPWKGGVEIIDKGIQNTRVAEISGVGHWLVIEAPEETFKIVSEFIKEFFTEQK
ncbi:Alpha/Beta hydrolase protein [Scheffersomyces xylosifermentans]|uniref:Alpha/Beta hydrolase protein n=1 Tax=Scheffersomyces xylosifermentans TaxID=1304137 RepID=UPI00315C64A9